LYELPNITTPPTPSSEGRGASASIASKTWIGTPLVSNARAAMPKVSNESLRYEQDRLHGTECTAGSGTAAASSHDGRRSSPAVPSRRSKCRAAYST
jgi:hypothetical protein